MIKNKPSVSILEKRVKKGVKFLNSKRVGWYKKVSIEVLDLSDETMCVLGKLSGDFWNIVSPRSSSGLKMSEVEAMERGFWLNLKNLKCRDKYYPILTAIWRVEIAKLKGL